MKNRKVLTISILSIIFIMIGTIASFATNETTNTVEDEVKSNNSLQSITIDGYELSPNFNENILKYYLVVPTSVTSLEVNAVPEIETAKVKITGNTSLTRTENTIKIVVTSENGENKTYNIIVNKQDSNGLTLNSLEIEGGTLTTDFNPLKYSYDAEVKVNNVDNSQIDNTVNKEDADYTDLKITAIPNVDTAEVEILGDKNLQTGLNFVTIIVRDGEKVTNYQLNVNLTIEKEVVSKNENAEVVDFFLNVKDKTVEFFQNDNNVIITLSVVAGLLVIIIIIVIVKMHKRKNKEKNIEQD